jgi:hypothetical protein
MLLQHAFGLVAIWCCALASAAEPIAPSVVGRWQYIQPPDREGEVLDVLPSANGYRGIMNGLERAGAHGLFYYVVEVKDMTVALDGAVSFIVGERAFYSKRPPLSATGMAGQSGFAREPMRFDGRLEGSDLVLTCVDTAGSCPDKTLRFKRITRKAPGVGPP